MRIAPLSYPSGCRGVGPKGGCHSGQAYSSGGSLAPPTANKVEPGRSLGPLASPLLRFRSRPGSLGFKHFKDKYFFNYNIIFHGLEVRLALCLCCHNMQSSRYARGFSSQSRGTLPSDSSRIYLPKDHTKIGRLACQPFHHPSSKPWFESWILGLPSEPPGETRTVCPKQRAEYKGAPSRHVSPCVLLSYRGHSALTNPPSALASRARKPIAAAPQHPGPAVLWHSNWNCPSLSDLINH